MRPQAALIVLLVLCAAVLPASEVGVRIRDETLVAAPRATLADVAELDGNAAACARIGAITVAELPTLSPVRVDVRLVTALATRAAAPEILRITGRGTVARQPRTFSDADLYAAAAAALVPGASIAQVRCSGALTVPEGARLEAAALDPLAVGEVPYCVRALDGERECGRALVVLRVERLVDVVVAARNLRRGEPIGPADLRTERCAATRANLPAVVDPAVLVGSLPVRDLAAGEAVSTTMVVARPAVRAGSTVTALWPGKGFYVELQATALADARAGERVGVRRVGDRALLTCIAQPDGTVLVQP